MTGVEIKDVARPAGGSVGTVIGGQLGVSHLVERRHRRVTSVGGPFSIDHVADRHRAAAAARATRPATGKAS